MSVLEARGLVFDHPGPLRAVDGVDLELRSGECLAILGPNGAGKSTLLRLMAGLLEPTGGEIRLDGAPAHSLAARERARRVAFVPQALEAVPEVSVGDFVLGGRYAHLGPWRKHGASDRAMVRRALEAADSAGLEERALPSLSVGQRQRVLIARALAQESTLCLVDEPTSSLDPEHQLSMMELVARLAGDGRAVAVVTHDLNLASQFASRVVLLEAGRVVASGTPAEVLVPAVLEPVYGARLKFGSLPGADGAARTFVLPWADPGP